MCNKLKNKRREYAMAYHMIGISSMMNRHQCWYLKIRIKISSHQNAVNINTYSERVMVFVESVSMVNPSSAVASYSNSVVQSSLAVALHWNQAASLSLDKVESELAVPMKIAWPPHRMVRWHFASPLYFEWNPIKWSINWLHTSFWLKHMFAFMYFHKFCIIWKP